MQALSTFALGSEGSFAVPLSLTRGKTLPFPWVRCIWLLTWLPTKDIYSRLPVFLTHPPEASWDPHTCSKCTENHLGSGGKKVGEQVQAGSTR